MMEFEGEFTVDGTPGELWRYFTDPDILQQCAPGCEEMTLESPSEIKATLAVGVGSVKPSFDVDAVVAVCDEPDRLELRAGGEASRNSFEVTAWQELVDNGDGTTTVEWRANAEVSGIIASMGERALGSVANKLVNNFFEDLESCVNEGVPAESRLQAASEETLREAGFLEENLAADDDGTGGDAADDAADDGDDGDDGDDSGGLMDRLSRG
jgi:carbon monoxide dehydrogenase subunit G